MFWQRLTRNLVGYTKSVRRFQCQDSWSGPTGSFTCKNIVKEVGGFGDTPVPCRRSTLTCNGALVCNFRDPAVLEGHVRYKPDDLERQNLLIMPMMEMNERASQMPSATIECAFLLRLMHHSTHIPA